MARKTLYGVAAVAVVAIAVFVIRGWPPAEEGAQGTIGAAKQYRADQIQGEDVVLQDRDIQELVQTDFFHRLVTDKSFQKMVADGSMKSLVERQTVSLAHLSQALERAELRDALARGEVDKVVQEFEKADVARNELERAELRAELRATLERSELRDALARGEVDKVVQEFEKADVARNELQRAEMKQVLGSEAMRALVARNDIEALSVLGRSDFTLAAAHVGFDKLVLSESFKSDMASGRTAAYITDRAER